VDEWVDQWYEVEMTGMPERGRGLVVEGEQEHDM